MKTLADRDVSMFDGMSIRMVATIINSNFESDSDELQEIVLLSYDESEDENIVLSSNIWIAQNYFVATSCPRKAEKLITDFLCNKRNEAPFLVLDYGFDMPRVARMVSKEWLADEMPAQEGTVWPIPLYFALASLDVQLVNKYFDFSCGLDT
jgi:hypothetical protein